MEHPVLRKLRRLAGEYDMLPPGALVLVAVSGGGDSMCLLHALLSLRESLCLRVAAGHFNHRLRPEAEEEETLVRNWCAARGVPCYTGAADVAAEAAAAGTGIEETARHLRYRFLEETAENIGADRVATAHHAGDNTETVLLNLIRGAGSRGLAGIPPVRGIIVRPLLTCERREIADYLARHGVPFAVDSSNSDTAFRRNCLRREILPRLEALNPRLNQRLWETACQLRRENECLDEAARSVLKELTRAPEGVSLPCRAVTSLPEALSLRGIQLAARELLPEIVLSAAHRRAVLDLCRSEAPSGEIHLPGGLTARRGYDRLELVLGREANPSFSPVSLPLPGSVEAAGWRFACRSALCPEGKFNRPRSFYLALPEGCSVTLRPRRTGDAIALPGRDRKTVKKLLIDAKVPRRDRDLLPVLECGGTVCALTEFGADQRFLPGPGEPAWHITVTKTQSREREGSIANENV